MDCKHPRQESHPLLTLIAAVLIATGIAACGPGDDAAPDRPTPPQAYGHTGQRPPDGAKLMGMNIGAKNYFEPAYQAALAKLDIVVLGFYAGWRGDRQGEVIRDAVRAIKSHNARVLVGQYTILSEHSDNKAVSSQDEVIDKIDAEGWWLRNAAGQKVRWTAEYAAWDINFTDFSRPDANGQRYPQWYADWVHARFFAPVPEFDFRYFDNFLSRPLVQRADWKGSGVDQHNTDADIASAYRRGQMATVAAARRLAPAHSFQLVNIDVNSSPEYAGQLNAAYLEALIGKSWSLETWAGWEAAMNRYRTVYNHLAQPKILGFNAWGARGDLRAFRYGLTSALMGDGYFSYTLNETEYSTVPWFDEYEVPLGAAVDPWPSAAWQNGVWRRTYQKAMVLVNPTDTPRTVDVGAGWRRFSGLQAPEVNSGAVARMVEVPSKDGLILVKSH